MNANDRINKITEYLRYDFTPEEFTEHARTLARMNQELARSEERKKSITAELASDVKRHQDQVANQSRLVSNGYEYRYIECSVEFDKPTKGKKTIVRIDTGEVVHIKNMTGEDTQAALNFEEAQTEQPPEENIQ